MKLNSDVHYEYHQFIPLRPKAKGRPRVTQRGFTYTPKATVEFERSIKQLYQGPNFGPVPVQVNMDFTKAGIDLTIVRLSLDPFSAKGLLTGDVDNYQKGVL